MKKFSNESICIEKGIKWAVSNIFVDLIFGFSLGIRTKEEQAPSSTIGKKCEISDQLYENKRFSKKTWE